MHEHTIKSNDIKIENQEFIQNSQIPFSDIQDEDQDKCDVSQYL